MQPTFLVIGSAKCATTSLCSLITSHCEVAFSTPKEPCFFNDDERYGSGRTDHGWQWYESLFASTKEHTAIGEGSTDYTMREIFPNAARRIANDLPDVKLIYIVRDPIARMESVWIQSRASNIRRVPPDFDRAIHGFPELFIASSNYWRQINVYRELFAEEQILVLFQEDLQTDTAAVLRRCFEFIGVDPDFDALDPKQLHRNPSEGKRVFTPTLSRFQGMPGFSTLMKLLPRDLKATVKEKLFSRVSHGRPQWDSATQEWVLEQLRDDLERFLLHYGKPRNFWQLCPQ